MIFIFNNVMIKKKLCFSLIVVTLLFCNCTKECECIMHGQDGHPISDADPVIETMPYGLKLDCSFFDDYVDTVGGYKCK